jgi:hypothetical protein
MANPPFAPLIRSYQKVISDFSLFLKKGATGVVQL